MSPPYDAFPEPLPIIWRDIVSATHPDTGMHECAFATADHTSSLYPDLFFIEVLPLSEIPFLSLPPFMQYLSISHTNGSSPLAALGLAQCCSIWVA